MGYFVCLFDFLFLSFFIYTLDINPMAGKDSHSVTLSSLDWVLSVTSFSPEWVLAVTSSLPDWVLAVQKLFSL